VFDVFERIRRRMPARLVFIGDGPDRAAIEARVRASAYSADVTFEGEQRDPVPLLSCADLFLLPSSQESFGMAALEAMACEVPVVASRIGGLPELIDDGRTGFLFDADDADDGGVRFVSSRADLAPRSARRGSVGRRAILHRARRPDVRRYASR
jgi:glycosyltransferase involved in cell wall biosynthesis